MPRDELVESFFGYNDFEPLGSIRKCKQDGWSSTTRIRELRRSLNMRCWCLQIGSLAIFSSALQSGAVLETVQEIMRQTLTPVTIL